MRSSIVLKRFGFSCMSAQPRQCQCTVIRWQAPKTSPMEPGSRAGIIHGGALRNEAVMNRLQVAILASGIALFSSAALAQAPKLAIPEPLEVEHKEIFEALEEATRAGGATGEAAIQAMAVLKPHFEKEERYALPQLGALESLAKPDAKMSAEMRQDLIARTAKFRAELPGMLDDHKKISAALDKMHKAAEAEKKEDAAWLAEKIMSHAAMEERVLYPAALLTGVHAEASK